MTVTTTTLIVSIRLISLCYTELTYREYSLSGNFQVWRENWVWQCRLSIPSQWRKCEKHRRNFTCTVIQVLPWMWNKVSSGMGKVLLWVWNSKNGCVNTFLKAERKQEIGASACTVAWKAWALHPVRLYAANVETSFCNFLSAIFWLHNYL